MTSAKKQVFIVAITDRQNATWQGTVMRSDEQEPAPFCSALGMLDLIESALSERVSEPSEN